MVRTSLCDTMYFSASDDTVSLRLANNVSAAIHSTFPLDESNLILRAAAALQDYANVRRGANIAINKRIPAEAGLAGGSGNAATTLLGLNRLWGLKLKKAELHEIAATLGSDINFFVEGSSAAVCTGRGELVRPIMHGTRMHFVVARPSEGNSTSAVFGNLQLDGPSRSPQCVRLALSRGRASHLPQYMFNRLAASAKLLNTEMEALLRAMRKCCNAPGFMSGSGSTCFVCADSARQAQRLARKLAAELPRLAFVAAVTSR